MNKALKGQQLTRFRCTGCGNCCRDMHVPVTDADVRRLMAHTGQAATDLVRFFTEDDVEPRRGERGWVKTSAGKRFMGLREKPDGSCQHLNSEDHCTVYDHRPVTCRMFPFNLNFDSARQNVTELEINDGTECLYELDGETKVSELRSTYEWDDRQDDVYFEQVLRWNRQKKPGTVKDFLSFLGLV